VTVETPGLHAFAFQSGSWRVRHRKLRHRLVGDDRWIAFEGTCRAYELLGGAGNVDDFFLDDPAGAYRAATFRRLDPETGEWTIHWADARRDGVDPPVRGRFEDGVGRFFGEDMLDGQPVFVRFLWSDIGRDTARWEQAFSRDGETWEVNWIMTFERLPEPLGL
jgi:hypothetical protein